MEFLVQSTRGHELWPDVSKMDPNFLLITSCVMSNGVRQGCPLSGLLFVLAIEVLAQAVRENENIHGLKINDTELKLSMYANDLTAFI